MKKLFALLIALTTLSIFADAQIRTPQPSPTASFKQSVGLTEITLDYSRPSMKDRTIFAKDGVVPFDQVWRLGANSATKFTFGDDVKLGGQEVKKGSWAVLAVPSTDQWKIMLYPYDSGNWSSYTEKTPSVTLSVKPMAAGAKVETFTINIDNVRNTSATIDILWENTKVSIPLEVEVDKRVMAAIDETLAGPTADDYYAAATYYHEAGKDLNQALTWIQKATSGDEPRFWQVRREALILADLGRYDEAVKAAEKSKMLAEQAKNDDYVRMNTKSIEEWSMKAKGKGKSK